MASLVTGCKPNVSELWRLRVRGTVQGVGFRPFIYRLALEHRLVGWVRNDVHGVTIEVSGQVAVLESFKEAIVSQAPPAAQVESVLVLEQGPASHAQDFVIVASEDEPGVTTLISADLPICPDCLRELRDPENPRYRYPFINCTNCGPRYSIIEALPYDRPLTTMKSFQMCPACEAEYRDPLNRRYHAQPTACAVCGPRLYYRSSAEPQDYWDEDALRLAVRALQNDKILAIKGLGGYHLACDARSETAVAALRERKFRKEKPFALMAKDVSVLDAYVTLSPAAKELLRSSARPIVLLPKGAQSLPEALAPDNAYLGVMLAYTPLHYLLFDDGAPELLVMTSANRSSEPIEYTDEGAFQQLKSLADAFLVGERPIARRIDDSVTQVIADTPVIVRRARGYAPAPVLSSARLKTPILALGAELKNSITLGLNGYAFVSQHLGELSNYESYRAFEETVQDLCSMYRVRPEDCLLVHDLHPAYASTQYALGLSGHYLAVQHHQAHIASVLAERDAWDVPVLGFSFDGTGLGEDDSIWGGEIFHGTLQEGLFRVGQLRAAALPGGDAAARTPVQAAVGFLADLGDEALERLKAPPFAFPADRVKLASQLVGRRINCPSTSSMGRLFDTVAALLGFRRSMSFEGQAAIWLESLAHSLSEQQPYSLPFEERAWDYRPLLAEIMTDVEQGSSPQLVARRFHETLAQAVIEAALALAPTHDFVALALSGGVFQNALLQELIIKRARPPGFEIWRNQKVPANDGGISLGQMALAAAHGG